MSVIISWRLLVPPVTSLIVRTLSLTVCRYLGSSRSRLPIWSVTSQPTPPRTVAVSRTAATTDGVRGSPSWRSRLTSGLSRNVRNPAIATGMKTDWAQ